MKSPEIYIGRRPADLVKRIGKGGEGEVWLMAGEPKRAVKIYTVADLSSREAKVRAMTKLGLADANRLVSYPRELATDKTGRFLGFSMDMVEGGRQIHELYGVKSRKINFPGKDYRFLVRAAANTARAVAQVHASPCVIGDLNESGILVRDDATVSLIDADSFQLIADGVNHRCLVGKPEFTPPELQGKSLGGIVRTKQHDQFGLAVAIFQLLCMGRHPYAGRYNGPDLTLDQFIARNLFAYSLSGANGVSPPAGAMSIDAFPQDLAQAFERAFGNDPQGRPTAAEWVQLLENLEGRLSCCATDPGHYFPSAAKGCPWCKMEAASGVMLFLPTLAAGVARTIDLGAFNVDRIWSGIKSIPIPEAAGLSPPLPILPKAPSSAAKEAMNASYWPKLGGVGLGILMLLLWVAAPNFFVLWLAGLCAALVSFAKGRVDASAWQAKFSDVDRRLDDALSQWRLRLGHTQLVTLRAELERAVIDFKGLEGAKAAAIGKLQAERRQRQLHDYLDRFLIQRANISGIGPAKTTTLRSFGIESAADVVSYQITRIPGFGPATAAKLQVWRDGIERRFSYNPNPTAADAAALAKVEADFAGKRAALAKKIQGGQQEMTQLAALMRQRLQIEDPRVNDLAVARAQLAVDLDYLKVPQPIVPRLPQKTAVAPARPAPPTPRTATPLPTNGLGATCPNCGSTMVRRVARRGRNPGRTFWGCSRYPICTGTRP